MEQPTEQPTEQPAEDEYDACLQDSDSDDACLQVADSLQDTESDDEYVLMAA